MRIFYLLLAVFSLFSVKSLGQNELIPKDSIGLMDFLTMQDLISGMGYRFVVPNDDEEVQSLSELGFLKTDSGFYSKTFDRWNELPQLEFSIQELQIEPKVEILIFSTPSSLESCRDYIATIIRNGDFQPILQAPSPKPDLIALASKEPYEPFQRFNLLFVSDYKFFIVTTIIILFFLTSTGLTLFMVILKIQKKQRDNLIEEYNRDLLGPLTSLPFELELEEIQQITDQQLHESFPKDLLQKKLYQEVLAEQIISLNKKMKGDFKLKLKTLYSKLHLDKMTSQLLEEKRWDKKTLALVQINEMDLVETLPKVRTLINHENFYVRSQAIATLLNLSSNPDLTFLRDFEFPLSNWQQMNYLRIIKFISNSKSVNLEVLFDSPNQSVRLFGYKLIRMLGRFDLLENLAKKGPLANDFEKIEILQTYLSLGAHMEVGFINECIQSVNPDVQLAALKTSAALGNQQSIDLILKIIKGGALSFKLKKAALTAFCELDRPQFESFITTSKDQEIIELGNHLTDPLLNNV